MLQAEENKSLKEFNTFGIDVKSRFFIRINSVAQLKKVFADESVKKMEKLIVGGGSNLLFTKNFDGLVLKNELKGIERVKENETHVWLKVGAGEIWHEFVLNCIANNWGGIENLSLIPGCVGAAPMQNIGAYGVEVKDVITEVETIELSTLENKIFTNEDCRFGYRESVFKTSEKNRHFIISVTFRLAKNPEFNISYGAIENELKNDPETPLTIKKISDAVIRIRQSKLPDPKIIGNAGSFFKNPEVDAEFANELKVKFPEMVAYKISESKVKIAAGWLIENAGWKGFKQGDFGVHAMQALVLVNYGNARGNEILELSNRIMDSVYTKYKIRLEREVNIV